jgi:hypothetical protein
MREFDNDPATSDELAAWKKAAEQIEASPGPEFTVMDQRFCIVAVWAGGADVAQWSNRRSHSRLSAGGRYPASGRR